LGVTFRRHSVELLRSRTLVGRIFMRNVAVRNASSQNFRGIDAFARSARPTSTI
jgi:hypothetical protein